MGTGGMEGLELTEELGERDTLELLEELLEELTDALFEELGDELIDLDILELGELDTLELEDRGKSVYIAISAIGSMVG